MLSGMTMSDQVVDRIERALKRIERAAASNADGRARLQRRNTTLRTRIESAIGDLDALIALETESALPPEDDADADPGKEAQG